VCSLCSSAVVFDDREVVASSGCKFMVLYYPKQLLHEYINNCSCAASAERLYRTFDLLRVIFQQLLVWGLYGTPVQHIQSYTLYFNNSSLAALVERLLQFNKHVTYELLLNTQPIPTTSGRAMIPRVMNHYPQSGQPMAFVPEFHSPRSDHSYSTNLVPTFSLNYLGLLRVIFFVSIIRIPLLRRSFVFIIT
jgi:hypothetical protein